MNANATLLTTKDVQALINVDKSTIYRMAEDGRIPAIKVGRQWRFPAEQIERWLTRPAPAGHSRAVPSPVDLSDLVASPSLQAVVELAGELLGVMAVVTDMEGLPLAEVANPCGFYSAVEELPGVLNRCVDGWKRLGTGGLEPQWIPSHLGFLCARTFIRIDTRLVGMVIVGGVRPDVWPPRPPQLNEIATDLGVEPATIVQHAAGVYDLDREARSRVLASLPKIADLVTALAAQRSELLGRFSQIAALAGTALTQDHVQPNPMKQGSSL
jgi:excisionase family DNA binding protein